ncbi:MAG TPA: CDP-alcohol phosphatidyltransferase family protein [Chloroflexia bacterium]|nr:CDP-alcohol phosphatidyltransferase family protein [Chloroflexia bacterium]
MANLITLARVVLLFITVGFVYLSLPRDGVPGEPVWVLVAAVLTLIVFISDGFDGMVARARGEANATGAVFDIAGDRIVENVYWVMFAHIGLLSVWFPFLMLARSFLVDGLRALALSEGKTPFGEKTMMTSPFGLWLAASRLHRGLYGAAKVVAFMWLLIYIALELQVQRNAVWAQNVGRFVEPMRNIGVGLALFALLYALARGVVVVWDSRHAFWVRRPQ